MIHPVEDPTRPTAESREPRAEESAEERANAEAIRLSQRLRKYAVICWVVFAVPTLVFGGFMALIGLTCSGLVVMIGHLWLERILDRLLLPAPQVSPWRLGVHILARFMLLGLALAVAIFVARFSPISVILGFSIIVGAIMIEAAHALLRSGDPADRAE
jgi:predicted histidine transporter YuiF (NhaC family)